MKAKSSYKSQMKSDRKRGQKQKQKAQRNGASNWHEIGEMEWMAQVGCAVIDDDVEALNILAQDRRFSIFDIHVDVEHDGEAAPDQPLMAVACHVGAAKCLEQICFIAASTGNAGAVTELINDLYASYESEEGDKRDLERMLLAALKGAEKGLEGPSPGIFLILSLNFPSATRFAMTSMADRPCGAVTAPDYVRVHIQNKRKAFDAMARGDAEAIDLHLRRAQSNLQEEANLVIGDEEIKRMFQVAAACGRPESIVAAFKTLRGLQGDLDQKGAVLALLMGGLDEMAITVNKVGMPWLDQAVKDCVELAVIEDRELGETILGQAGKMFFYTVDAAKSGALAAIAELERRELASHTEMYEVIERVSSALRV